MSNILRKGLIIVEWSRGKFGTRGPRACTCKVLFMHYFSSSSIWGQLGHLGSAKLSVLRFLKHYSNIFRQISTKLMMESMVNMGNIWPNYLLGGAPQILKGASKISYLSFIAISRKYMILVSYGKRSTRASRPLYLLLLAGWREFACLTPTSKVGVRITNWIKVAVMIWSG